MCMKTLRDAVCALLALVMSIVGVAVCPAGAQGGAYPVEWDLSGLYASTEEWQADYERAGELIQGHAEYRGRLCSAQTILEYYERFYMGELSEIQSRLYVYAALGCYLNPANAECGAMLALLEQQNSEEARLSAFAEPEICALPLEERRAIFADPLLKPYDYAFKRLLDPDYAPLSEEAQSVLATLSPALGRAGSIYGILNHVEIPSPVVNDPEGAELELDTATYMAIMSGGQYDRDFRSECYRAMQARCQPFANTFAALLDMNAASNWAQAQLKGYGSAREAALAAEDVESEIYDRVIAAAHAGTADYQRYLKAHARGLGLEEQYSFDMTTYVSDYDPGRTSYDHAVDDVRAALSALGDEYVALYDELVTCGHIDVYPAANKSTGSFSAAAGGDTTPYVMLNFTGTVADAGTLAHEAGHAIYSMLSARAQEPLYETASVLTQEVASLTNEMLYYTYKMENAASEGERLAYLENMLSMFSNSFFIQALYAEFEDAMYGIVERGGSLDAEALGDMWQEMHDLYYGGAMLQFNEGRCQWAEIPHFYYNYYVYRYAVAVCCASALCCAISEGRPDAAERYLDFLAQGGSASPSELLAGAGADPLSAETYESALNYFARLVDEYEALMDTRG